MKAGTNDWKIEKIHHLWLANLFTGYLSAILYKQITNPCIIKPNRSCVKPADLKDSSFLPSNLFNCVSKNLSVVYTQWGDTTHPWFPVNKRKHLKPFLAMPIQLPVLYYISLQGCWKFMVVSRQTSDITTLVEQYIFQLWYILIKMIRHLYCYITAVLYDTTASFAILLVRHVCPVLDVSQHTWFKWWAHQLSLCRTLIITCLFE